jgi:hypothetical protein
MKKLRIVTLGGGDGGVRGGLTAGLLGSLFVVPAWPLPVGFGYIDIGQNTNFLPDCFLIFLYTHTAFLVPSLTHPAVASLTRLTS